MNVKLALKYWLHITTDSEMEYSKENKSLCQNILFGISCKVNNENGTFYGFIMYIFISMYAIHILCLVSAVIVIPTGILLHLTHEGKIFKDKVCYMYGYKHYIRYGKKWVKEEELKYLR